MKKIVLLIAVLFLFVSCSQNEKVEQEPILENQIEKISVIEFEEKAENLLDKEVEIEGTVIHICKHSGKRVFIIDGDEQISVKIEAQENSPGFKMELMGSKIKVNGKIEETRLTKAEIDEQEHEIMAEIDAQKQEEGDDCVIEGTKLENLEHVNEMKAEMERTGKPYVSFYYIRCNKFEEVKSEVS